MTLAEEMTYLAIDYGSRRIGLAKSDPTGTIASALETIEVKTMSEALQKIEEKINIYQPQALIIGYPLLQSGDKSDECKIIDQFVEKLTDVFNGPVYKVDESYSSIEAAEIVHAHGKKTAKDKGKLDRLAAVIILQRFLDEQG